MKIEPRGKYPGVKVHLDKKECEDLLELRLSSKSAAEQDKVLTQCKRFTLQLGHQIRIAQVERPDLLDERTEEQIIAELEAEKEKSEKKLAAIADGKNWQGLKASNGL